MVLVRGIWAGSSPGRLRGGGLRLPGPGGALRLAHRQPDDRPAGATRPARFIVVAFIGAST
jgi:hypothetical protein